MRVYRKYQSEVTQNTIQHISFSIDQRIGGPDCPSAVDMHHATHAVPTAPYTLSSTLALAASLSFLKIYASIVGTVSVCIIAELAWIGGLNTPYAPRLALARNELS